LDLAATSPGALPSEKVDRALKSASETRTSLVSPAWDLRLIHYMWQLLNIAHDRHDAKAAGSIEALLSDWSAKEKGAVAATWLDQALHQSGPALRPAPTK
jgi:hypothetical protein